MTSPTYDPTSGPVDPGVKQSPPRLGEGVPPGTFADSEMEYSRTERSGERYDQPGASGPRVAPPSIPPRVKRPMSRTRPRVRPPA